MQSFHFACHYKIFYLKKRRPARQNACHFILLLGERIVVSRADVKTFNADGVPGDYNSARLAIQIDERKHAFDQSQSGVYSKFRNEMGNHFAVGRRLERTRHQRTEMRRIVDFAVAHENVFVRDPRLHSFIAKVVYSKAMKGEKVITYHNLS
jgi:hypothetical protein